MHELGVVFYVVKDVKQVAEENQVDRVSGVVLQIGEVSGIVHHYLTDCWNWARKKEPVMEDAELKIEQIDAVSYCEDCKHIRPCSMQRSVRTAEASIPICCAATNFC